PSRCRPPRRHRGRLGAGPRRPEGAGLRGPSRPGGLPEAGGGGGGEGGKGARDRPAAGGEEVNDGSSGGGGSNSVREGVALVGFRRESHDMAVFAIALTEDEQRVVNAERDSQPEAHVRRKMLIVWLLHCGLTRAKAAEIAGLSRPTVQRYVATYRTGGLDGLRRWDIRGPGSDPVAHTARHRRPRTNPPLRTAAR